MAAVAAPTAAASTGTKSSIVAGLAVIDEERVRRCLWKLEHDYEGPLPDDHGELTQKNDVAFEDIKELRMSYECEQFCTRLCLLNFSRRFFSFLQSA